MRQGSAITKFLPFREVPAQTRGYTEMIRAYLDEERKVANHYQDEGQDSQGSNALVQIEGCASVFYQSV